VRITSIRQVRIGGFPLHCYTVASGVIRFRRRMASSKPMVPVIMLSPKGAPNEIGRLAFLSSCRRGPVAMIASVESNPKALRIYAPWPPSDRSPGAVKMGIA